MQHIKTTKYLKQYDLRIIGNNPNYPFHQIAQHIELMLNTMDGLAGYPIRVHIFDKGKPMLPYELGHRPEELIGDDTNG